MTTHNLAASRFILQRLLDELDAYDRDIPIGQGLRSGETADALLAFLSHRDVARLSQPKPSLHRRLRRREPAGRPGGRSCHDVARRATS